MRTCRVARASGMCGSPTRIRRDAPSSPCWPACCSAAARPSSPTRRPRSGMSRSPMQQVGRHAPRRTRRREAANARAPAVRQRRPRRTCASSWCRRRCSASWPAATPRSRACRRRHADYDGHRGSARRAAGAPVHEGRGGQRRLPAASAVARPPAGAADRGGHARRVRPLRRGRHERRRRARPVRGHPGRAGGDARVRAGHRPAQRTRRGGDSGTASRSTRATSRWSRRSGRRRSRSSCWSVCRSAMTPATRSCDLG